MIYDTNSEVTPYVTYIYLIFDNLTGLYKIGRSKNPNQRFLDLKNEPTKLPIKFDFRLLKVWPTSDIATERCLHKMFERYNARGEWFDLEAGLGGKVIERFMVIMQELPNVGPDYDPGLLQKNPNYRRPDLKCQ